MAEDVRLYRLTDEPGPMIYFDNAEVPRARYWIVRTKGDPMAMFPALKEAARKVDPTQSFREVLTLHDSLNRETAEARFYMFLLSTFAAAACCWPRWGYTGWWRSRRRGGRRRSACGWPWARTVCAF